jgi:hypothetical protein
MIDRVGLNVSNDAGFLSLERPVVSVVSHEPAISSTNGRMRRGESRKDSRSIRDGADRT